MAPESVGVLETELNQVVEDIKRMQEEHPDEQFPDGELDVWNLKNRMVDDYKKRIELARRDQRMKEIEGLAEANNSVERIEGDFQIRRPGAYQGDPFDMQTIQRSFDPAEEGKQFKDRSRAAVEKSINFRHSNVEPDKAKEYVTNLIEDVDSLDGSLSRHILVNGSPRYKQAFGKYLQGAFLNQEESRTLEVSRALSLTGAAGGYAVPTELDPTIIPTSNLTVNPFRSIARVIPVTVDNWNGVSAGAVTAGYGAEATPTTDSSPTLAQVVISTERASSFIPFSIEVGQDWGALQAEMGRLLGDAKDTLEATKFTVGSGTNEPFGVITGVTTLYTAASTTALSVADLYGLELALPPRFRSNASMLFQRSVAQKIRGFDTGTGAGSGSNVWIDNLRTGVSPNSRNPDAAAYAANVLGYPAYESVDMDSAFTTGKKLILFGDFSYYIIIDRIGMNVEVIPHLFDVTFNQPTGQRGLYAYWRNGAKVASAAAFVTLRLA